MSDFTLNDHISWIPNWNDPEDRNLIKLLLIVLFLCILVIMCSGCSTQQRYQSKYAKQTLTEFQKSKY